MSSQTVYFYNPTTIANIQNSIYADTADFTALSNASIVNANPIIGTCPFTYYSLAQNAQALLNSAWNTTNQEFFQAIGATGIQNWPRADWMANQFMSGAVALGLATGTAGYSQKFPSGSLQDWTFRLSIVRTDGTCLYDSLAAQTGAYLRISTLG